ncbi:MAG: hypothetical protein K0S51_905 [Bacillales bacterium]|nr:hypothetical protein [Bacillales bacterium]
MIYDIIGDIHGCLEELEDLLEKLGYKKDANGYVAPPDHKVVFLGDLTDRGPDSVGVINLVYDLVIEKKIGIYVPGNHCRKLHRYFIGRNVQLKHGIETTDAELKALNNSDYKQVKHRFMMLYEAAPLYFMNFDRSLVVAHAGISNNLIGKQGKTVETFVFFGDITGETLPDGRPVRLDWAKSYNGKSFIVYGHTPVTEPRFKNNTVNIDTGCVFGGKLTSVQFPSKKITQVESKQPHLEEKFSTFES